MADPAARRRSRNVAVGRDVLNWGPAQFRLAVKPVLFDNGRSDPMRELSGMDSAKSGYWTPDRQSTLTLAYVANSGHDALTTIHGRTAGS